MEKVKIECNFRPKELFQCPYGHEDVSNGWAFRDEEAAFWAVSMPLRA